MTRLYEKKGRSHDDMLEIAKREMEMLITEIEDYQLTKSNYCHNRERGILKHRMLLVTRKLQEWRNYGKDV